MHVPTARRRRARRSHGCLSVCEPMDLVIPARRTILRTIRPAPCRSSRRPSAVRKTGPSPRSPVARSIALAVLGASRMVTTLPPLRVIVRGRCPRSRPRYSISAPVASDTRSLFSASSEISACSGGGPARQPPAGLPVRCGPARWHETHSPGGAVGHVRPGNDPGVLLRPCSGRTLAASSRTGRAAWAGVQVNFVAGPGLSQHRPLPWLPGVYLIGAGVLRHMQRRPEPVRSRPA